MPAAQLLPLALDDDRWTPLFNEQPRKESRIFCSWRRAGQAGHQMDIEAGTGRLITPIAPSFLMTFYWSTARRFILSTITFTSWARLIGMTSTPWPVEMMMEAETPTTATGGPPST